MTKLDSFTIPQPISAQTQAILTIDLSALIQNWRQLAHLCAPAETAAVVKADAYGIGLEPTVQALARAGCRTFFVAHVSEGIRVRSILNEMMPPSCSYRIYVFNGLLPRMEHTELYIQHKLQPVLGSWSDVAAWMKSALRTSSSTSVLPSAAIHIDTGMNRLGFGYKELEISLAHKGRSTLFPFPIDLVMTHCVASEDENCSITPSQIARFEHIRATEFADIPASFANSSALFLPQHPFYDVIRPGYALYGGNPTPRSPNPMRSVVSLQAPILSLRYIEAGERVGYGGAWQATRPTRLATMGVGYGDGLPRSASRLSPDLLYAEGAEAYIKGILCPYVGHISMDLTIIDVTDVPENALTPDTYIEILGPHVTIDDLGRKAGTIGYEILTRLGHRYQRIYTNYGL